MREENPLKQWQTRWSKWLQDYQIAFLNWPVKSKPRKIIRKKRETLPVSFLTQSIWKSRVSQQTYEKLNYFFQEHWILGIFSVFKSTCRHLSFPQQHMHRHVCLKTFSSSLLLPTRVPCLIRPLFSACRLKPKPMWIPWHPGKLSLRLNLQTPPVPRAHGLRGHPTPASPGEILRTSQSYRNFQIHCSTSQRPQQSPLESTTSRRCHLKKSTKYCYMTKMQITVCQIISYFQTRAQDRKGFS